jgi:hypothetical protein
MRIFLNATQSAKMRHQLGWIALCGVLLLWFGYAVSQRSFAQTDDELPANEVHIEARDGYRYISSNGIPNHATGEFPNRNNPSRIAPQRYNFRVTLSPRIADKITSLPIGKFGIAVNGIPFDPSTAEWWDNDPNSGWHQAARAGTNDLGLDYSNAHVQPNGAYHYHGLPYGWLNELPNASKPQVILTGWAADGFPIYSLYGYANAKDAHSKIIELHSSYRLKQGTRPNGPGGTYDGTYEEDYEYVAGAGELDECNGRFGVTSEFPSGTYYYVLTKEYPFVPHAFRGTPDSSFSPPRGGGRGPNGRGPGGRDPNRPPPFGHSPFGPPPRF